MRLIELLEMHDFRLYRQDLVPERLKQNSNTVRIHLSYNEWFEFGINEWTNREDKINNIKQIITKDVLNRKVQMFQVNEDLGILEITLDEE